MLDLNIPTFIFSLINLVVIYVILKKLLFVPITRFMEKRKNAIIDSLKNVEVKEQLANEKLEEYDEKLRGVEKRAKELYEKNIEKARNEYENIVGDAKKEAEKIKANGYIEIEKERESLSREIKAQVTKLSIQIASKLLKENMDTEKNKKLVDQFLSSEDVA